MITSRMFPSDGGSTVLSKPTRLKRSGSMSNTQVLAMSGYEVSAAQIRLMAEWRNVKHARDVDYSNAMTLDIASDPLWEGEDFDDKKDVKNG